MWTPLISEYKTLTIYVIKHVSTPLKLKPDMITLYGLCTDGPAIRPPTTQWNFWFDYDNSLSPNTSKIMQHLCLEIRIQSHTESIYDFLVKYAKWWNRVQNKFYKISFI